MEMSNNSSAVTYFSRNSSSESLSSDCCLSYPDGQLRVKQLSLDENYLHSFHILSSANIKMYQGLLIFIYTKPQKTRKSRINKT